MRTIRRSGCPGEGLSGRMGCLPIGGVRYGVVCLLWGYLPERGVSARGRGLLPGGGLGCLPARECLPGPPLNRMTDTCKNIT